MIEVISGYLVGDGSQNYVILMTLLVDLFADGDENDDVIGDDCEGYDLTMVCYDGWTQWNLIGRSHDLSDIWGGSPKQILRLNLWMRREPRSRLECRLVHHLDSTSIQ